MSNFTRRSFTLAALAGAGLTAACNNGVGSQGGARIDARVDSTLNYLFNTIQYPRTCREFGRHAGDAPYHRAGLALAAASGGARSGLTARPVDYYSATKGSFGLQIGGQQFSHVLFFQTEEALTNFRRSSGWAAGADVEYVFKDEGENLRAETTSLILQVVAVIFGQAGIMAGASLEGVNTRASYRNTRAGFHS